MPAAAGLVWLLAIGPRAALAGFTAGPRQVLGYLTGTAADPAGLLHRLLYPGRGYAGLAGWLPRQAPLALLAAAAEAAVAWWLRWLHRGHGTAPAFRPGLVALARRQFTVWSVKQGGVAGRAGAVLGVDWPSGQPAEVPWPAAERGVLVAGDAAAKWPRPASGSCTRPSGAASRWSSLTWPAPRAWPGRWPRYVRRPARRCTCSARAGRAVMSRFAAATRPGTRRCCRA